MPFLTQEEYINSKIKVRFGGYLAAQYNKALTANTPVKVANELNVQADTPDHVQNISVTNGRLTNNSGYKIELSVNVSMSASSSNPNLLLKFRGVVNTTTITASETQRYIGSGGDVGAVPLVHPFIMENGDYLDFEVESDANTTLTIEKMSFDIFAKKIFT